MAIYRGDGGAGVANPTYETAVIADQTGNSGKYLTTDGSVTSWATVSGGSSNLDGLTDVTITSPLSGQVLKYNGTIWVNDTDSTGSGSFTYPGAGIAVSTGSAWGTSLTDNSANWDTAYTDRFKWDGGSTGLTASTGRTSLGVTATGSDTTYNYRANNLSDVASVSTARTNLGVTATGADTTYAYRANNLSDLASASTARTNLGLGTAATMTGPSGTIVGTTDTQTLSAKTLTSPIISSISNTGTLTLPTSTDTLIGRATTDTLTNKRITSRVGSTTSSATPTINTDNVDMYGLTAQAVDITSFTTNLTGTPTNGQKLWIYIVGTAARAITWGASFEASTVALPTTTVTTNRLDVGFVWNAVTSKWRCVAVA